jgi:hypothetical protein
MVGIKFHQPSTRAALGGHRLWLLVFVTFKHPVEPFGMTVRSVNLNFFTCPDKVPATAIC